MCKDFIGPTKLFLCIYKYENAAAHKSDECHTDQNITT